MEIMVHKSVAKKIVKIHVMKDCKNYACKNRIGRYSQRAVCPTCRKKIKEVMSKREVYLSYNNKET